MSARPNDFAGKRVVVVGLSNTAADATTDLSKVTTETYISHRTGARVVGAAGIISEKLLLNNLDDSNDEQRQTDGLEG